MKTVKFAIITRRARLAYSIDTVKTERALINHVAEMPDNWYSNTRLYELEEDGTWYNVTDDYAYTINDMIALQYERTYKRWMEDQGWA